VAGWRPSGPRERRDLPDARLVLHRAVFEGQKTSAARLDNAHGASRAHVAGLKGENEALLPGESHLPAGPPAREHPM